jgi:hypothetical protein
MNPVFNNLVMKDRIIAEATASIEKQRLEKIQTVKTSENLNDWCMTDLLPKGKKWKNETQEEKIEYLLKRVEVRYKKRLEEALAKIENVFSQDDIENIDFSVEWKKNSTWGSNPTASATIKTTSGYHRLSSSSISGCGYDKESTAIAQALNSCPAFIKMLFKLQDHDMKGLYGFRQFHDSYMPSLSGGVGTSCYYSIFEALGFKMEKVASGKSFDSWIVRKA